MITLNPSAEQRQIVESVEDFLKARLPVERFRDASQGPGAAERREWPRFVELGWFGFALPEEQGGVGLTLAEQALVFRELGRHLVSPAVFATGIGAQVAALAGKSELAGTLLNGQARCALGIAFDGATVGENLGGEWQVVDGDEAQYVLVWSEAGVALADVATLAQARKVDPIDEAVSMQRGFLSGAATLFLPARTSPLRQDIEVLIAAQLAGAAEAVGRLASDYARIREQFGRPIGAFQGVAHACADMAMRSEVAWAQTKFAALAVRDRRPDAELQLSSALLMAADAAYQNATRAIRVHGGIGFTADCDAHRYLKRAVLLRQAAGGLRIHQARLLAAAPAI